MLSQNSFSIQQIRTKNKKLIAKNHDRQESRININKPNNLRALISAV